jgi:hypothetical protein
LPGKLGINQWVDFHIFVDYGFVTKIVGSLVLAILAFPIRPITRFVMGAASVA